MFELAGTTAQMCSQNLDNLKMQTLGILLSGVFAYANQLNI